MKFKNSLIFSILLLSVVTISISGSMQDAYAFPATVDMTAIDLEAGTISITITDTADADDITIFDVTSITVYDETNQGGNSFTLTSDSSTDVTAPASLSTTVTIGETDLYNLKDQLTLTELAFSLDIAALGISTNGAGAGSNGGILSTTVDRNPTDDSSPPTLDQIDLDLDAGTVDLIFSEGVDAPTPSGLTFGGVGDVPLTTSFISSGGNGDTTFQITLSVIDLYNINADDSVTSDVDIAEALTNDGADTTIAVATVGLDTDNPDATLPTLDQIDLDLDAATLVLTFSEGVDIPTESAITIDGAGNVPLTTSSSGGSNGDTTFTITLSAIDQYNISADNPTGTVDYTTALTTDGTNNIAAVDDDTLDTNDPDISAPTLDANDSILDLDSNPGTLTLFFNEGVDVPEPTAITLIGSSNVPLTGGTVLESAGATEFTIQLSEIDRYNISADHSGSVDFDIAEALTQNGADIVIAANTEILETKTLDTTAPTLDTTTLNLNAVPPTLTLTFNEGVDIPTVTDITIAGTAGVPLTGVSEITTGTAGSVTFIITLGDLDHYNISANDDNSDQIIFTGALTVDGADVPIVGATQALAQTPDTTRPIFTARRTSATNIEVTFSEFVDSSHIDGTGWSLSTGTVTDQDDPAGTTDTINLTVTGLDDTGIEPTLTYSDGTAQIVDGANNEVLDGDNVTATDEAPPTWSAVHDSLTQTTVTFSEPMDGLLDYNDWAFGGGINPTGDTGSIGDGGSLTGVTEIIFTHAPLAFTDTEGAIFTNGGPNPTPDDLADNTLTTVAESVDEQIPPTFSVVHQSLTTSLITFSEQMDGTLQFADWTFAGVGNPTDSSGPADGGSLTGLTGFTFTHAPLATTGTISTLTFTEQDTDDVTDNDDSPTDLADGDATSTTETIAPTMDSAITTSTTTVDVTFSEAIDDASVSNTLDFTVGGFATTDATSGADTNIVTLTVDSGNAFGTGDTPAIVLTNADGGVDDLITPTPNNLASDAGFDATDGLAPTLVSAKTGPTADDITYTFSEAIDPTTVAVGDFANVGVDIDPEAIESAVGDTVVVRYESDFALDFEDTNDAERFTNLAAVDDTATPTANTLTQGTGDTSSTITDGLEPSLISAVTGPGADEITYTFDEDILISSVQIGDFVNVDGRGADDITTLVDGTDIIVSFDGLPFDTNDAFTASERLDNTITDLAGNEVGSNSVEIGDGLAADITTNNPLTATFVNENDIVNYDLSEAVDTGSITFTFESGPADNESPHTYAFQAADKLIGNHQIAISTLLADAGFLNGGTLVDGTTYTIAIDATDDDANVSTTSSTSDVTYDITDPTMTPVGPGIDTENNNLDSVTFDYSEDLSSGSLTFTETGDTLDGNDPHIINFAGGELAFGPKSLTFAEINTKLGAVNLIDGATYTIEYDATDLAGNVAGTIETTGVKYDTTAPVLALTGPLTTSFNNNDDEVSYTIGEDLVSGTITLTGTAGPDDTLIFNYDLTLTQLDTGAHTVTFAELNTEFAPDLQDGSQYTITFNGEDAAGNPATQVSIAQVNYDISNPTFTPVGPASGSENGDSAEVTYELLEDLSSGTITFTHQSGVGDLNPVHVYTLTAPQLLTASQAISFLTINGALTNDLVDGAIYNIDFAGFDLAGNPATPATITNVKYDMTAPIITPVTIFSDSATNTEWAKDGDTVTVTITGNEDLTVTGATINGETATVVDDDTPTPDITYLVDGSILEGAISFSIQAQDEAGNKALLVTGVTDGTFVTVDKTAPVVTGNTAFIDVGGNTELTTAPDQYIESCTATDVPHLAPSCGIQSGGIDTTVLGLQTVTYEAIDEAGNVGTEIISTTVEDNNPPSIGPVTIESDNSDITMAKEGDTITVTITGDEILEIQPNPTINGLPATIDTNNALTVVVSRTVAATDSNTLLTPFSVFVEDPGENSIEVFSHTVGLAVVTDTTAPTFTVQPKGTAQGGSFTTNIIRDFDTYTPNTIDSPSDGAGSGVATSVIDGDTLVDESALSGTDFTVTYTVTDNAGNSSVVTETVTIIEGGIPVISLTGTDETIQVQSTYVDAGAEATDAEDNNTTLTNNIVTTGLPINTDSVGVFVITYDVTDSSGNDAVQVTRTVTVEDTTDPVITILGNNPETVALNSVYTDAGATATDVADGIITGSINTVSTVNTGVLGDYTVTYDVTDSQGNVDIKIRDVEVTLGNAPVVTVTGGDITFKLGAVYTEQGATCEDVEDGTLTVTQTGSIDQLFIGEQTTTYSCTDSSGNITEETRTVTIQPKGGGGKDNPKSAPTSGLDWNTNNQIVDNGIVVNGKPYQISDNWHTDFVLQTTAPGSANNFSVKTYAQNGGIWIQEIAFGVPGVGQYHDAEALIEVYYNYDKTIDEVRVIQDTEVVDESALVVSTSQVNCRADSDAQCYQTNFKVTFREPLQDDVFAIKAIDLSRRSMMPTYLNDGLLVDGESLNPAKSLMIPGPVKYEGLIEVTQSEKYSDLWFAADGRIFEMFGESDSFRLVSHEKLQRIDTGDVDNRNHSGHEAYRVALAEEYKKIFDSSEIQKLVPESFAYAFPDVDSRTQFLIDNGLLEFVRN